MDDKNGKKRKRGIDDSGPAETRGAPRFLPIEIWSEIGKNLVTDNPANTGQDLTNFKLTNTTTRNAVEQSSVGTFHKRINRLGSASQTLRRTAIPDAGIEPSENYPQPDPHYAEPDMRVAAAAPTFKFQSPVQQSRMVDQILQLDPDSQGDVLRGIASDLGDLHRSQQARLIERSIAYLKEPDAQNFLSGDGASLLLANAHARLSARQKAEVLDALHDNPDLMATYLRATRAAQQQRVNATDSAATVEIRPGASIDQRLSEIATDVRETSTNDRLTPHAKMEEVERIGNQLGPTYDEARALLMNRSRGRGTVDY